MHTFKIEIEIILYRIKKKLPFSKKGEKNIRKKQRNIGNKKAIPSSENVVCNINALTRSFPGIDKKIKYLLGAEGL